MDIHSSIRCGQRIAAARSKIIFENTYRPLPAPKCLCSHEHYNVKVLRIITAVTIKLKSIFRKFLVRIVASSIIECDDLRADFTRNLITE